MKKRLLKIFMAVTALGLFFCQYACAGSAGNYISSNAKEAISDGYYADEDYYQMETRAASSYYSDDYEAEFPAYEKDYKAANGGSNIILPDDSQGKDVAEARLDEKLVYTCNMTLETIVYEDTITALRSLIKQYDGIIQQENYSDSAPDWYYTNYRKTNGTLTAYIVVRIPSAHYREFLAGIEGQGKVVSSDQSVENITRRYSETQTTISSLETQEKRLLEMMETAETIDEMLAIEDRLTDVQNELQILRNRLSEMDTDVAYSTVNLTIREVIEYTPEVDPVKTLTFGDRLKNTLEESWDTFTDFLEGLLFFVIRATPILLVIGAISLGIMFIIIGSVKSSKKRAEKKAAKKAAAAQPEQKIEIPEVKE